MRMSTTSRSGHQQEIAPEKWLSYYFRTLTDWGKEEWQRNISQRFNNPRHFSRENFNSQLSNFNLFAAFVAAGSGGGLQIFPAHLLSNSPGAGARARRRLKVSQFISNIFSIFAVNKSTVNNNGHHSLPLTNVLNKYVCRVLELKVQIFQYSNWIENHTELNTNLIHSATVTIHPHMGCPLSSV